MKKLIQFLIPLLLSNIVFAQTLVNAYDSKGRNHGKWVKYYENTKVIRYEGQFLYGKPVGEFTYYYSTGNLQNKVVYEDSGKIANSVMYYPNATKYAEGKFIDKKKDGVWTFYDGYGNIIATDTYQNGLKNGTQKTYTPEGKLIEEKNFLNNTPQGEWKRYFSDGKLSFSGNLQGEKWEGEFVFYSQDGKKMIAGNYLNSLKEGDWLYWDENGILIKVVTFKAGVEIKSKILQKDKDPNEIERVEMEYIRKLTEEQKSEINSIPKSPFTNE